MCVLADLVVAELQRQGRERADTAFGVTGINFVCAAQVFDDWMSVPVSDALVGDDGPDVAADVGEVGSEVHGVDAVREGSGETWDCDFGEFAADTCVGMNIWRWCQEALLVGGGFFLVTPCTFSIDS